MIQDRYKVTCKVLPVFRILIFLLVCLYPCQSTFAKLPPSSYQKSTIILGGDHSYPPSTFIENGRPTGFQVDIIKAVAAASGLEVRFSFCPWKEALEKLRAGEVDVIAMSYSQQREADFDFSVQFALNAFGLMVREDSDIKAISDIKGHKILVQQGGVMRDYIESSKVDADITFLKDATSIVRSLSEGKYDGAFLSQKTAFYVAKQLGISDLRFTGEIINPRRTAFGVTEGNYELIQLLNEGLAVINSNGQLQTINEKWFGSVTGSFVEIDLVKGWALRGGGFALLVLALFILWTRSLKVEIKERKRVEKALQQSEKRFKALHDASFGGIIIHDKGLILDCNQGLSDITGFTNKELVGMNGLKLIAPDSLDQVLENIKTGYDKAYEVEGVRKDGSIYPLYIKGKNIPYMGREARVIEFRDITERKKTEAEIKKLRGILPLCSFCKKIRDDKGYWEQVDVYIHKYSEVDISHSICPKCMKENYPEE